jgi:serine/threonine protein kinase/tetratricopeptide (TPR) repeat protein
VRRRVDVLLAAHREAGTIPHQAAAGAPALEPIDVSATGERPGTVIGAYKLLEQIGEGGFGVVFLAEQQEPIRRKVALKIIKPGMDSKPIIARFEAERQALALMDHPNIARVLDAGTTPGVRSQGSGVRDQESGEGLLAPGSCLLTHDCGRPYFVMELVNGPPITDFCDQGQYSLRQRLELFVDVCLAVQHAHQKGIIHRDLKPSNVLVTLNDGTPLVKLIDFGIAKALGQQLTDKVWCTGSAQIIGTPLYMSPEQAALSVDVDTRSDVYSLGVLLYELLTGTTPFTKERFKHAAYDEMLRIIRDEEPPRPSTRISTLGQATSTVSSWRKSDPRRLCQLYRGELDWIVMKALDKNRNCRYETANGLARDIERYLNDEPVQACPPSAWYRFRKFARRRKAGLAFSGMMLAFLIVLGGGFGWVARDRAARRAVLELEVPRALEQAHTLQAEGKWSEAWAVGKRTEGLLAGGGADPELQRRVDEFLADLHMIARLEVIRLERSTMKGETFDRTRSDGEYATAFRDYGIDVEALEPAEAAARIQARTIPAEMAAALDVWALDRKHKRGANDPSWKHLVAVAQLADPDPWRSRMRDALKRQDEKAWVNVLATAPLASLSPSTLLLVSYDFEDKAATDVLRMAQQKYPGDFWINHYLGERYSNMGSAYADESLRFHTAALAIRPQAASAHFNVGHALNAKGRLNEAASAYRAAIALKPDYARAYSNLGGILCDHLRDLDGAIRAFEQAIRLDPNDPMYRFNLGNAHLWKGNHQQAIAAFHEALRLKPDYADAYCNLGTALAHSGAHDDAIAVFQKAIDLNPKHGTAHVNLANEYLEKHDFDRALAAAREAIRLQPNAPSAHVNAGLALKGIGQIDQAIAAFREAIRRRPDFTAAHYALANALKDKGEWDEAIAEYRAVIRLKPDHAQAHATLGVGLALNGRSDEAITEYRAAIRIEPGHVETRTNLGLELQRKGQIDEAISEYRAAIRVNPDSAAAHNGLGRALGDKGQWDEAVAAFRQAIRLKPDFAEAHCNLGWALQRKAQFSDALASYWRGHELGTKQRGWSYPSARWVTECARRLELDNKLPKILRGEVQAASAAECLELAWLCHAYKHHHAAATRFYADAFAADPELADNRRTEHRYTAAVAAIQAGRGQGNDAGSLDQADRARLRRQALDWLRADLATWQTRLEKEPDQAARARKIMRIWQQDRDLSCVRGADELSRWPEAERRTWRQFWDEVEALARRGAEKIK